jgi:diguanylate cyclase (GGDEF)-like protein
MQFVPFDQLIPRGFEGVMADIDHFKKINDRHGHPVGDAVLREVASRLLRVVEGKGLAFRYGGEEYAVILPNHSLDEALAVAERVRTAVEAEQAAGVSVTSSYGVAIVPSHASTVDTWLKAADDALYDAKRLGRNLVTRGTTGAEPPRSFMICSSRAVFRSGSARRTSRSVRRCSAKSTRDWRTRESGSCW